jgi:hypothetical protein
LTANIGDEGSDQERVEAIYEFLIEMAEEHGNRLQIIVADNSIPAFARKDVLVAFTDEDKLIPQHLLSRRDS